MLPVTAILSIIDRSLQITLLLLEGMSPQQRAAFADRHEQRMAFWTKFLARFTKDDQEEQEPT